MFQKLKNFLLELIFPKIDTAPVEIFTSMFCAVCRARLATNKKICHKNSLYKLSAATAYDGITKDLIWRLKYQKKRAAIEPLKEILYRYLENLRTIPGLNDYLVIPIPLFPDKERERGFNQSQLIAEAVAEYLHLKTLTDVLIKTKDTPAQAQVDDWAKRKTNVQNSFAVTKPEIIKGQKVIIVDDVWTSGATMNEAARILKNAGAKNLIGFVIAKAG